MKVIFYGQSIIKGYKWSLSILLTRIENGIKAITSIARVVRKLPLEGIRLPVEMHGQLKYLQSAQAEKAKGYQIYLTIAHVGLRPPLNEPRSPVGAFRSTFPICNHLCSFRTCLCAFFIWPRIFRWTAIVIRATHTGNLSVIKVSRIFVLGDERLSGSQQNQDYKGVVIPLIDDSLKQRKE